MKIGMALIYFTRLNISTETSQHQHSSSLASFQQLHQGDGPEQLQVAVSLAQAAAVDGTDPNGIQVVNAESGDTMHIDTEHLKTEHDSATNDVDVDSDA